MILHLPPMNAATALAFARGAAQLNQIVLSRHARQRAGERGVTAADIRGAILSATAAHWDSRQGTWKLTGGLDVDGHPLTTVITIEDRTVRLITEF